MREGRWDVSGFQYPRWRGPDTMPSIMRTTGIGLSIMPTTRENGGPPSPHREMMWDTRDGLRLRACPPLKPKTSNHETQNLLLVYHSGCL